ncbi:MAG: GTPase Era [Chlorobium sp.]|uniref:GTPase Era n=1 Tax=Chlorobium sp. TaxID=1095 RepID=UPI0025C5E498|nr:GTPase Era [Chlorobium sp.]MCF8215370.1 GTPase Era [Chlorobium sp.]MCF8270208.1 GTPase Era [Chlorobium sp.]MCF8286577.1 GTPase Era [Chlorobium sp.]MCF8290176.1 GTPase Era [Chlorobium sp.]MCF8384335.1 GTPase Era [Chlorobium sp.]
MNASVFSCGFAVIAGPPNAGKSTLLNRLLDCKLSIVTPKPQTTRKKITGIYHDDSSQIIFLDTPGIMQPQQKLHESMLAVVRQTLQETDVIIALIPYCKGADHIDRDFTTELFDKWLKPVSKPLIAVLNKSDLVSPETQKQTETWITNTFSPVSAHSVSARKGSGLDKLIDALRPHLPMDEPLYPEEMLSTAPERFFVSEIIREKIFLFYGKEIPYATEVVVDEFKEQHENDPSRKDLIRCSVIVERDTQKQILIGNRGSALKKLGQAARADIEELLGRPVFLELFIKVRPDWRKKQHLLKSYGY